MTLYVDIRDKVARLIRGGFIICDNSDYVVNFTFDSEWDATETKTARFIYGDTYEDVVFEGNSCSVPVIPNARSVRIGLYAGALRTTTPAYVRCVKSVRTVNGAPSDPTAAVYDQILALLNNRDFVSPEDIEQAVADYMAAHPSSGSYSLPAATDKILGGIKVGTNLSIEADGTLSVDMASAIEEDNTKPVSSANVYTEIGNINALLATI